MNSATPVSVLVKQDGSAIAEMLHRGLSDAGAPVVLVPTAYDVVAEAHRAAGAVEHILLGIDHFGPGEFRLIPLVRREWPETVVVAYHTPGFEHKGRIAELVGADIVLSTAEDASRFLAHLPSPGAAEPAASPPAPAAAFEPPPAPVPPVQPRRPPPLAPAPAPAARPEPAVPPADAMPAPPVVESYLAGGARTGSPPELPREPPPQAEAPRDEIENLDGDRELEEGKVLGMIELTDEELRVLLGEEDDA